MTVTDYRDTEKETRELISSNNVFEFSGTPEPFEWCTRINGITCGEPLQKVKIKKIKRADKIVERNAVDEIVYDTEYYFNEEGIRSQIQNPEAEEVALFFGDALTFGEGLINEETMPYFFQQNNPKYQSYNYGFLGHGPGQMLLRTRTKNFRKRFKNKKGKVFFLYRDDAVKISAGKVPWCEAFPNFILKDGELIQDGEMPASILEQYLPGQYTDEEFELTAEIFNATKNELAEISPDLELCIVLLPLAFSASHMSKWLEYLELDYTNLFFTDLEYRTDVHGLKLDGSFTKETNEVLSNLLLQDKKYKDISPEDFDLSMEFAGYSIPAFIHFPPDDAGVFISQIFRRFPDDEKVKAGTEHYMDILRDVWTGKQKLLKKLKGTETKAELKKLSKVLSRNKVLLDIFYDEYING